MRDELALVEPPIRREECQDVAHVLEIVDLVRSAPRRQGALGMGRRMDETWPQLYL